jgi:nicotinate-nucleotide adenylyltransferase
MIIANYLANHTDLDRVWLVVSPQNPFKQKESLANDYARLDLVRVAIGDTPRLAACDIEVRLPQPSYTVDTLTYLAEKHPEHEFVLIMGGDSLASLPKWKNPDTILKKHSIFVYKRPGHDLGPLADHPSVRIVSGTPQMELSATFIRECLRSGKSVRYFVPDDVYDELMKRKMY